jgi:hypothetical protein
MLSGMASFELTGISWEDSVLPQPLKFAPPLASLASNTAGFSRAWQFYRYLFDLPNPSKFPALKEPLPKADLDAVNRFVVTCEKLAGYSLISGTGSVKISVPAPNAEPKIVTDLPSSESVTAATTLFRQLHAKDENASFHVVSTVLGREIQLERDELFDERSEMFRAWKSCSGKIQARRLSAMVARKAIASQGGHPSVPVPFEDESPIWLISLFEYGDLIHWGDKREKHEALMQEPVLRELAQMRFLESVTDLSHFYFGYSLLLRAAFPQVAALE